MRKWFTSDQHFYHSNIIKYCNRPFSSVEEMNEVIIMRHNEAVAPDDVVTHIGDFSLSKRAVEVILPRLNGIHHLIAGNHDHCHPIHAKKPAKLQEMRELYMKWGFKSIELQEHLIIDIYPGEPPINNIVLASHLPYTGDHYSEPRFLDFRPRDVGLWLLHGHVHTAWRKQGRQINVGVDQWNYYPVSEDQILALIAKGEQHNE